MSACLSWTGTAAACDALCMCCGPVHRSDVCMCACVCMYLCVYACDCYATLFAEAGKGLQRLAMLFVRDVAESIDMRYVFMHGCMSV